MNVSRNRIASVPAHVPICGKRLFIYFFLAVKIAYATPIASGYRGHPSPYRRLPPIVPPGPGRMPPPGPVFIACAA